MAGAGQRRAAQGGGSLSGRTERRLTARPVGAAAGGPVRTLPAEGGGTRFVNQGRGTRTDLLALAGEGSGRAVLARYDLAASSWPVRVTELERHPRSDQAFFALDGADALLVVAPSDPDGEPDLARAEAFRASPDTPFLYPAGLWHAPLFALERPGLFLMAMREHGDGRDTEMRAVASPLLVGPG